MSKAKVMEMMKKWGPYVLVAVIAGAVGGNSIGCDCGKNRGKGDKVSRVMRGGPMGDRKARGSAGDRGEGRWMREGMKERMEAMKARKAEAKAEDAANQEG